MGFAIHWHESAMDLHVFPIPFSPPAFLPIPSLWVFSVHQPYFLRINIWIKSKIQDRFDLKSIYKPLSTEKDNNPNNMKQNNSLHSMFLTIEQVNIIQIFIDIDKSDHKHLTNSIFSSKFKKNLNYS